MPGDQFDEVLRLRPDGLVEAAGPISLKKDDPKKPPDTVMEMCVWVVQANAASNAMTGPDPEADPADPDLPSGKLAVANDRWRLVLPPMGDARLADGAATAVAIGVRMDMENNQQKALLWVQPVTLAATTSQAAGA